MNDSTPARTIVAGLDDSIESAAAMDRGRTHAAPHDPIVALRAWELRAVLDIEQPGPGHGAGFQQAVEHAPVAVVR